MSRRLKLIACVAVLLTLNGCVFYGHPHSCCWRPGYGYHRY